MFELCCKSRPFSSVTTNGSVLHKHSHVKPSTRGGFSVRVFHQTTYKREKENIIHCRRSRRMQRFELTTGYKTNLCIWNSFACLCVLPSPFSPEPLSSQILCLRLRTGLEITHLFARTLESEGRWIAGCQVTSQLNMWRRCKWESSHFGVNNSLITLKWLSSCSQWNCESTPAFSSSLLKVVLYQCTKKLSPSLELSTELF